MADSFNKKEREKRKKKRRKEKAERKEQRKQEGKTGLEFMYLDEDGNLSPTPPDPSKKKEIKADQIEIGVSKRNDEDEEADGPRTGTVKFFNQEKRFGFIIDQKTNESIFVHADNLIDPIKDRDKVTFEMGNGPKGPFATGVKLA